MRNVTILMLVLTLAVTLGCQTNPKFQAYDEKVDEEISAVTKVPVYFWDRFLDLTDILQLNLAFGNGGLFNLHISKAFQIGGGTRDGVCFGIMPRSFGMWYEDRVEGGIGFLPVIANLYYKNYTREALWGTTTLFDHDVCFEGADHVPNPTSDVLGSNIGLSVHALIGFDIDISVFQIWDFVFGFIGMPFLIPVDPVGFGTEVDLANDDVRARKVRNDSDMPYYNYPLDPHPKRCKCKGDKTCTCTKCSK